jgi:hydrogenase maturation protease
MQTTLIGIGNLLLKDEGVGIHAVRALESDYLCPPQLEIVDGGTAGLDLLPYLEGRDRVLLVDAVDFGQAAGHIGVLKDEEVPALFNAKASLHHLGLADVLAAARLLDTFPRELRLIGIQPLDLDPGLELSPALQRKMPALLARILEQLQSWGIHCPGRPPA